MALLYMQGWNYLSDAQLPDDGWSENNVTLGSSYSRFSGNGIWGTTATAYFFKNFNDVFTNKSTLVVGFAFNKRSSSNPTGNTTYPLLEFRDNLGTSQIKILITNGAAIRAYRGDNTSLGLSSDNVVKDYKWHYLEVKVTVHDTTGIVEVKLDETTVLNLTSQDTKNGTDYLQTLYWRPIYSSIATWFDDIYIDDANFLGDCHVKHFMPDADGNSSDFTRSTGSNDYECVDETPSNEDTDYISSNTVNHKSIFGITTGSLGTVKGVQVNNHCRVDDAGTRKIKAICRSNGADYQGTETPAIGADYNFYHEVWENDPDDAAAWNQTKLEAAEFGLEITT